MKNIVSIIILSLAFCWGNALAHHPAADIVDEEIYAMIDEMVADTPHATLEFDDMGNTIITADSVSEAEDLVQDGLLADLSLLDEDVTVTISFGDVVSMAPLSLDEASQKGNRWTERDDWGRAVIFTVNTKIPCDLSCPQN